MSETWRGRTTGDPDSNWHVSVTDPDGPPSWARKGWTVESALAEVISGTDPERKTSARDFLVQMAGRSHYISRLVAERLLGEY